MNGLRGHQCDQWNVYLKTPSHKCKRPSTYDELEDARPKHHGSTEHTMPGMSPPFNISGFGTLVFIA